MKHFNTILIVLGLAITSFWLVLLPDSQLGNIMVLRAGMNLDTGYPQELIT